MMVIAAQDTVTPITPLGSLSPAISEPQARQATEMDMAHNLEALELASKFGLATFIHR